MKVSNTRKAHPKQREGVHYPRGTPALPERHTRSTREGVQYPWGTLIGTSHTLYHYPKKVLYLFGCKLKTTLATLFVLIFSKSIYVNLKFGIWQSKFVTSLPRNKYQKLRLLKTLNTNDPIFLKNTLNYYRHYVSITFIATCNYVSTLQSSIKRQEYDR